MTAHRITYDLGKVPAAVEPGDAGSFEVAGRSMARFEMISSGASETRTLPIPFSAGQVVTLIHAQDGGDIDITVTSGYNEANDTAMNTATAGDFVTFYSIAIAKTTFRWRIWAYEGFTGITEIEGGNLTVDGTLAVTGTTALTGAVTFSGATDGLQTELVDDGTTILITAAQSGAVFDLDSAAAAAFTLPSAAVGLRYTFVCSITVHASTTIDCGASDFYVGALIQHDTDTAASELATVADGSNDDRLTLNATTTGGLVGSYINMLAISTSQWLVWGHLMHNGSVADPFSAP